jgi:hypothetical protein
LVTTADRDHEHRLAINLRPELAEQGPVPIGLGLVGQAQFPGEREESLDQGGEFTDPARPGGKRDDHAAVRRIVAHASLLARPLSRTR